MADSHTSFPRMGPRLKAAVLAMIPLILAILIWERIPAQDAPEYFSFADQRHALGIPNIGDVLSNLPFIVVGWLGIQWSSRAGNLRPLLVALAISSILTGFGSSYFHWEPNVSTLFWDRLPMVLLFSSLIGLLIADRVDLRAGESTARVLALFSVVHLVLWKYQVVNLRPYFVLQFGAFLWLVLFNLIFRKGRIPPSRVWAMLGLYAIAKVMELKDMPIFHTVDVMSGHTLKHLFAAVAVLCVFLPFRKSKNSLQSGK